MSELITLINYIAVSIFGSILSAAFCGIGTVSYTHLTLPTIA